MNTNIRIWQQRFSRATLWSIAGLTAVLGVVAWWAQWAARARWGYPMAEGLMDIALGYASIAVGVAAHQRRPANPIGLLLAGSGLAGFVTNIAASSANPWLYTAGSALELVPLGMLWHVALVYPEGRFTTRLRRSLAWGAYGGILGLSVLERLAYQAGLDSCHTCPPNPVLLWHGHALFSFLSTAEDLFRVALGLATVLVLYATWRRSSPAYQQIIRPVLWTGIVVDGGLALSAIIHVALPESPLDHALWWALQAGRIVIPVAFGYGLLRSTLGHIGVTSLNVALASPLSAPDLERAVRNALQDPSADVLFWDRNQDCWVDAAGAKVEPRPDHRLHRLDHDGELIGAISHDPALELEPELLDGVAAALGTALANSRLHAENEARVAELGASRRRLVQAEDRARRKLERELHDGAQHRLLTALAQLNIAADRPDNNEQRMRIAIDELAHLHTELRDLAQGIHSESLARHGLAGAIETLAARSPIPVTADVPGARFAATVEETAWYVIREAHSNTLKHADATEFHINAAAAHGLLRIEISDNGRGGADQTAGSGLQGLLDRVATVEGTMTITSPPGRGTRLEVDLPCE